MQPAEPLDLWESPPFELTERDGRVYARGVSDDKGQLISRLAAIRAVRAVTGGLPERVKFLVEGEEEISSPTSSRSSSRTATCSPPTPASGSSAASTPRAARGGARPARHPLRRVSRAHALARRALWQRPQSAQRRVAAGARADDDQGRRRPHPIPGFYDAAQGPTETDLQLLAELPSTEEFITSTSACKEFVNGHTGMDYRDARSTSRRPISPASARAGRGRASKTVIPAYAMAKMDFRLVPDQDPEDLSPSCASISMTAGFSDVEVVKLGGERPARRPATIRSSS